MSELFFLFENENFLAVDKPAGWLTVPGRFGDKDERPVLGLRLQELKGRVWPLHRLDADVGGLVLWARNENAHRTASAWFEKRLVSKSYEGLTAMGPEPDAGRVEWTSRLLRGKKRAYEHAKGKASITRAECQGTVKRPDGDARRWELEPLTGRSHQLRYELSKRGWPLIGDTLYGSDRAFDVGLALRSVSIDFSKAPLATELGLPTTLTAPRTF